MSFFDEIKDEAARRHAFPVTEQSIFMAHAGVSPLPRVAAEAMREYAAQSCRQNQESPEIWMMVAEARRILAALLGGQPDEIALLGPTALGLNLVALGLPWREGDEVVYHPDDYPANVYPWLNLASRGVTPVPLRPERPGEITWDLIEQHLTPRTRLVALASCHFLTGHRVDVDGIGRALRARDVLFCLDAIQTAGAFPLSVEHVDFLSADSHKWLLGPVGAGVFYVKKSRQELLRPALVGSWNVASPEFVAQPGITFEAGARRYEPGSLNLVGIAGMLASVRLLLDGGVEAVAAQISRLRALLRRGLCDLGFELYGPTEDRTGILSVRHAHADLPAISQALTDGGVVHSLRRNRRGDSLLRFSPHFYNTAGDVERVVDLLRQQGL